MDSAHHDLLGHCHHLLRFGPDPRAILRRAFLPGPGGSQLLPRNDRLSHPLVPLGRSWPCHRNSIRRHSCFRFDWLADRGLAPCNWLARISWLALALHLGWYSRDPHGISFALLPHRPPQPSALALLRRAR